MILSCDKTDFQPEPQLQVDVFQQLKSRSIACPVQPICVSNNPCIETFFDAFENKCIQQIVDQQGDWSCDDGNPCTRNDVCVDHSCDGELLDCVVDAPCVLNFCTENQNCVYSVMSDQCYIDDKCLDRFTQHPKYKCLICDPDYSTTQWTQICGAD